ncbi:MAG: class I SAM-dependent methyltransferase [Flavobacteriales bacterium]|nr:class I SAM-dependent methyltransferase [Flavobacteriales bacterium]
MNDTLRHIGSWMDHLVKARSRHGVHSPFVYQLADQVLRPSDPIMECLDVEHLREGLLRSDQTIRVNDLGAGSRVLDLPVRNVADMARTAMKPARHASMLYRLARYFNSRTILELGTSFGLTTLYLSRGAPDGRVITIEGCPQTFRIAQHHFEHVRQQNIQAVLGSFRVRLPEVLKQEAALDLVFIDGNHAKEPTLDHFEQCLTRAHNDTVFVLDDIHWSRGMEAAWEAVKAHGSVTVTVDLHHMGLVFLRREQPKEHFRLRY